MSDDLSKVVFGEPIECRGQKPDGFPTGRVPVQWSYNGRPYLDVTAEQCKNFGLPDQPVLIRLPVDVAEPKGLTTNKTLPSDDIAKRMEALVRAMAGANVLSGFTHYDEAKAIVALLPKPVDADLVEARKLAVEHTDGWGERRAADILAGLCDDGVAVPAMLAAIRRGRALERDSREG